MSRRMLMAEASGERARGRPGLGWLNGVKLGDLGQQKDDGETARQCAKDGKSGETWCISR